MRGCLHNANLMRLMLARCASSVGDVTRFGPHLRLRKLSSRSECTSVIPPSRLAASAAPSSLTCGTPPLARNRRHLTSRCTAAATEVLTQPHGSFCTTTWCDVLPWTSRYAKVCCMASGFMTADWHLTRRWHETQDAAATSAAESPDSDGTLLCTVRDLPPAAADALADALLEHGALSAA